MRTIRIVSDGSGIETILIDNRTNKMLTNVEALTPDTLYPSTGEWHATLFLRNCGPEQVLIVMGTNLVVKSTT